MRYLRQSTIKTQRMGPFIDDTDFKTPDTALSTTPGFVQADIMISKDGGAFAQTSAESPTVTHDMDGYYAVPLTALDTGTLGPMRVQIAIAGAMLVWEDFHVITANAYDSMFSTDKLEVDLKQMGGVEQSATDLKKFADDCYDPTTDKIAGVVTVDTTTENTDMRGTDSALTTLGTNAPAGWVNAAAIGADAITADKIADNAFVDANFATGSLDGKGDWNTTAPDNANIVNIHNVVKAGGAGDCAAILSDTDELQRNQTGWATATNVIVDSIANDAITALSIEADAVTKIQNGLSTFDASSDTVTTDSDSRNASKADVSTLATTAALANAQLDLDTITGADGAILNSTQANYAPNTVVPMTAALSQTEHDATQTAISGLKDFDPASDEVTANITKIGGDATLLSLFSSMVGNAIPGTIGIGSTTTVLATDLTVSVTDRIVNGTLYLSGTYLGERALITGYNASTKEITVSPALTEAPIAGTEFIIG